MTARDKLADGATKLVALTRSRLDVADPRDDVRGEEVGTVDDLLIDNDQHKVPILEIEHGGILGIGADYYLVPVGAVARVTPDEVHIDGERARLRTSPVMTVSSPTARLAVLQRRLRLVWVPVLMTARSARRVDVREFRCGTN